LAPFLKLLLLQHRKQVASLVGGFNPQRHCRHRGDYSSCGVFLKVQTIALLFKDFSFLLCGLLGLRVVKDEAIVLIIGLRKNIQA
jgi:hypothetical protein